MGANMFGRPRDVGWVRGRVFYGNRSSDRWMINHVPLGASCAVTMLNTSSALCLNYGIARVSNLRFNLRLTLSKHIRFDGC